MLRRLLSLSIAAILSVPVFAACSNSAAPNIALPDYYTQESAADSVKGRIEFYTFRDDLLVSHYPAWIAMFNEQYPDIHVVLSTSKNFESDFRIRMATNDMPDLITFDGIIHSNSHKAKYLMPLDDVFPDLLAEWIGNDANVNTEDRLTYALTFGLHATALIYNKIIFSELGLEPPETLDELIAAGQAITESGRIGLAGCLKPGWTALPYLHIANLMMGDQLAYHKEMLANDAPFTLDSPIGVSMQVFKTLLDAGIMEEYPLSYDWEPFLRDLGSGKTGMAYSWTVLPMQSLYRGDGSMAIEDFGMVPFPYDNSGGPYKMNISSDYAMAIAKDTGSPEAAIAFFRWHMDDLYPKFITEAALFSARKGVSHNLPYLEELNEHNPEYVMEAPLPDAFLMRINNAPWNRTSQYIDIAMGYEIRQILDSLNDAWDRSR